ncbi:MAG: SusC/RagA family TonB-linked outer membrane protein [Cyclonatronaceae bacterium]
MLKKLLTVLAMVLLTSQIALAQSGVLRGVVTDAETGESVPGANVLIADLGRGASSDIDGNYRIENLPAGNHVVTVSFLGYRTFRETVAITAGQTTVLNLSLQIGTIGLDELIVSGYAVTTKREVTGSISSVRAQEIQDVPLQNTESLLQGRAAGVNVTASSGNPGGAFRVNIRGNGSVNAATEPLYIIDGVQISFAQQSGLTSTSPLNSLNPSDIENIEILKDASSAAIYGAQAAAGVVLITTKQGRQGRTNVTFRAETGVRTLARNVDYISSEQYVTYMGEALALNGGQRIWEDGFDLTPFENAYRNFFLGFFGADPNSDPDDPRLANTDWQDFIFDDGVTQKYNLTLSGGDQKTTFLISGGWENTEGTAFKSDFTRLNLRTNFTHQITDRLSGALRMNVARSTQFGVCQDGNFVNCPPSQAMFEAPMSFPFLADGSYNPDTRFGLDTNPAVVRDEVDRDVTATSILGSMNLTYRAYDWLTVTGFVGLDYRNTEDVQFRSSLAAPVQGGWVSFANRTAQSMNTNLVVNATRTFDGVHNVSGLLGTEYRRDYSESQLTRGEGFPAPLFKVLSATSTPAQAAGVNNEWRLGSYFTNVKYNYDEKYLISFVGRYDGHSRFGNDVRWAFFPSVSAAWRLSEEAFFNVDFIDEIKLRVGYGTTGNSAIGNFASRGLYSTSGSYQGITGLTPSQLANAELTWEEATELNIGLDYELFAGRITGAIDVYQKDNSKLLFERPLPSDSGFGSIDFNIGKVRNTGIEFEISTVNVSYRDFIWNTRFNIAFIDNEILELPDMTDISPTSTTQALKIGKPIGLIQVPRWAGVNPADGRPMWYDADGNITFTPVQNRDAVDYKDGLANTVGGFGNTFSYKGLVLDAFFQFSFGQWAFPSTDYYFTRTPDFLMNMATEVEKRWRQPGDITHYPRAVVAGTNYVETNDYRVQMGTQSIYNASYIRLKNISLSYNLPRNITDRVGLQGVRVFASALNLVTWTEWPWYDPEVAFSPTDIFNNVTTASYPTEKQVNAGIEIRF